LRDPVSPVPDAVQLEFITLIRVKYAAAVAVVVVLIPLAVCGWIVYRSLNATWVQTYHI
jgi:hypothetical protein